MQIGAALKIVYCRKSRVTANSWNSGFFWLISGQAMIRTQYLEARPSPLLMYTCQLYNHTFNHHFFRSCHLRVFCAKIREHDQPCVILSACGHEMYIHTNRLFITFTVDTLGGGDLNTILVYMKSLWIGHR
jgi:hypothetical protein